MSNALRNGDGHTRGLARRIEAVRAELAEATREMEMGKPGARAMVVALRRDILILEFRLETARRLRAS